MMNYKKYWYWGDKIETILLLIAILILFMCAASCSTKKVAVSTATIDKSHIHIDSSMVMSYREDISRDKGIEYTVIEVEEKTVEEVKDTNGRVVSPAQKSVIKREITAVKKDNEIISRDTTITQMAVVEENRDIDTMSEEEIIPPNRTAMWVFFSLALVTIVGGAIYIDRRFF